MRKSTSSKPFTTVRSGIADLLKIGPPYSEKNFAHFPENWNEFRGKSAKGQQEKKCKSAGIGSEFYAH
jgi:hypothetical protein